MSETFVAAATSRAVDASLASAFEVFDISDDAPLTTPSTPPPPPPPPPPHPDLERFAGHLNSAARRSVIVLLGAGASVSAGIPDFRSPGTGLYDNLEKYNLPYAEAVFDIDYFRHNPSPFYALCAEMWPGQYSPTPVHRFVRALHEHGKLLRVFTQNIDSLETQAGIPEEMVVAAHGNFDKAHVVSPDEPRTRDGSVEPEGRKVVDIHEVKGAIFEGEAGWRNMNAKYGGLVKPAITFFGENLPKRFLKCVKSDFPQCGVLLIFGTSLMVQPFASLVRFPPQGTPRMLINRERRGEEMGLDFDSADTPDGLFLGDCDAGAHGLAAKLGWDLSPSSISTAPPVSPAAAPAPPSLLRLGLTRSATARQPESVVLVEPSYDAIVRAAANKLKMSAKHVTRLVVQQPVGGRPAGTELPREGSCAAHLKNDTLVWVSQQP